MKLKISKSFIFATTLFIIAVVIAANTSIEVSATPMKTIIAFDTKINDKPVSEATKPKTDIKETLTAKMEDIQQCQSIVSQQSVSSTESYSNDSGLSRNSGVNYHDGWRETYYSSNVLYHYRTGEWTADSNGVYRDSNGYVVVASTSDPFGSIVRTSFGPGKVYDTGCAIGTHDIYTNW